MKTEQQKEQQKAKELKQAKREAKKIAKELLYDIKFPSCLEEIDEAKTVIAVDRIMTTCRRAS